MDHFPLEGPYSVEKLIAAAARIAELWRYLDHATTEGTRTVLADPVDVYTLVEKLVTADRRAADVLKRLSYWARNVGDESTYTNRFASADPDGTKDLIQAVMHQAATELSLSGTDHSWSASRLDRAAGWMSGIYRTGSND